MGLLLLCFSDGLFTVFLGCRRKVRAARTRQTMLLLLRELITRLPSKSTCTVMAVSETLRIAFGKQMVSNSKLIILFVSREKNINPSIFFLLLCRPHHFPYGTCFFARDRGGVSANDQREEYGECGG